MRLKNIKPFDSIDESIFSKYTTKELIEEIYNMSSILNFMIDEGYMDDDGKIKDDLTVEDLLDGLKDQFQISWKSIDDANGILADLKSACVELIKK